jgi:hypothetical protein
MRARAKAWCLRLHADASHTLSVIMLITSSITFHFFFFF